MKIAHRPESANECKFNTHDPQISEYIYIGHRFPRLDIAHLYIHVFHYIYDVLCAEEVLSWQIQI